MFQEEWGVSSNDGDNASQAGARTQVTDDECDFMQKPGAGGCETWQITVPEVLRKWLRQKLG